jgi:hypothetical protein
MKCRPCFLIFALFATLPAFGQGLTVSYLEGGVEQMIGSAWSLLHIGDVIEANASLRLASDGYVEIAAPNGRIKISKAGS